ncbi:MAG: lysoplasmalogenase [Bacteroidota bacterium]|nr:lysoplasmalogenase [Bacteroidota bacterium]
MHKSRGWFAIFLILSALYLAATLLPSPELEFYGKPLLLLPLMVVVYGARKFRHAGLLLLALVFSWIGDVLLLFTYRNGIFFILGLVAFLIAHIFLITLFYRRSRDLNKKAVWDLPALVLLILYLGLLLWILVPRLGSLTPEVILYSLVISTMLYRARILSTQCAGRASLLLLGGAISFVLSDSTLAIVKFYHPLPFSSFWVMATYLFAQYGIVRSCVNGILEEVS